jgi:hypothetical protein
VESPLGGPLEIALGGPRIVGFALLGGASPGPLGGPLDERPGGPRGGPLGDFPGGPRGGPPGPSFLTRLFRAMHTVSPVRLSILLRQR